MAGQQPLKLLILVRIQVPEPRENPDFSSGFSLELVGRRFGRAPEPAVAAGFAPRSLRIQVPEPLNMNKNRIKILCFVLAILFGIFMFVYGEFDDSPGGQMLGFVAVVIGIAGIIKSKENPSN